MKKYQIHQFDPVIYPFKVWITIADDINAAVKERFLDGYSGKEINFSDIVGMTEAIAHFVQEKEDERKYGVSIIFRSKKYCTVKNIAHESSHAAKALFRHIGADVNSDECFEYLSGWIADCCYQVKTGKFKS
jgi:hypothetical protein